MAPGCEASEIDINTPTGTLTIVLSLSIFGRLHILDDKIQRESWSLLSCHINQIYTFDLILHNMDWIRNMSTRLYPS